MDQLVGDVLLSVLDLLRCLLSKVKVNVHVVKVPVNNGLQYQAVFFGLMEVTYVTADTLTSFLASCSRSYSGPHELSLAKISAAPFQGRRFV